MAPNPNENSVKRAPLKENPANSDFQNKVIHFLLPFQDWENAFTGASPYRKFCMVLNLVLAGLGTLLIGEIEIGLGFLLAYGLLGTLLVYLIVSLTNGFIVLNAADAVVVLLIVVFGFFATWYGNLGKSAGDNLKLNAGQKLKGSYIARFFVGLYKKCEGFFQSYHEQWHRSGKKGKTLLALSWFMCGFPLFFFERMLQGLLYFGLQLLFIFYMIYRGASDILGLLTLHQTGVMSSTSMVYGILGLCFVVLFLVIYFLSLRATLLAVKEDNESKKGPGLKKEASLIINEKFYVTALIVPVLGAVTFTIIPLVFMILVAFTNYSGNTAYADNIIPAPNLGKYLSWVNFNTFKRLFGESENLKAMLTVFSWTMIWAILATFTCYFGGLFLAMLLNKKCIKGKIIYRSLLVISMALPQFVSLLVMKRMFADNGLINQWLKSWGYISWLQNQGWISSQDNFIPFWETPWRAKTLIILINMWVGIPYYMLLMSGLLINIPQDYYEAAKIEGASRSQVFHKITLPYILYMTTPCLITSFVSNINNFNVIWFLTGSKDGKADETDILITWLYKITMGSNLHDYNFGAAIGIVMFIISASVSLIVYQRSASYKNEEEFR